jgi:phytoene dehydrogenase-like protein
MKKAAIIGAGVSGLIVGAKLAKEGFDVVVFEKSKSIGGRAAGLNRDGFSLDNGLHLIRNGAKGLLSTTMDKLGLPIELCMMSHPEFFYLSDGGILPFPQDQKALMETDIITMDEKMKLLSMFREGVYEQYRDKTLRQWLDETGGSDALGNFVRVLASAIVCPYLNLASAGEVFDFIRSRILAGSHPAGFPKGGYFKVLDKLVEYIRANGGKVLTDTQVEKININEGRVSNLETSSGAFDFNTVVIAFPYRNVFEIIDKDDCSPEVQDLLASLTPTSGICIDYALNESVTDLKSMVINYEEPFCYGMAISNLDPSVAPEGKQLLTFTSLTLPENMEDSSQSDELVKYIENFAFNVWPEIPRALMWKRVLKLKIVNSVQVNSKQYRDTRPNPRSMGIDGIYLSGDALNATGGGGDLAVHSANLCADAILSDKGERING